MKDFENGWFWIWMEITINKMKHECIRYCISVLPCQYNFHQPLSLSQVYTVGSYIKRQASWLVHMRRILWLSWLCWWSAAGAFSATLSSQRPVKVGRRELLWHPRRTKPSTHLHAVTISLRGGQQFLSTSFGQLSKYIGQSKLRCFVVLLCSIVLESYATSLSKAAKEAGSVILFVRAVCIYVCW